MGRIRKPPKPRDALVPLSLAPDARGAPGSLDARTYAREEFTELELEVIRRLLEKQEPRSIGVDLGLAAQALDTMLAGPRFQREYELQTRLADRGVRARMERLTSEALDVVREVMRTAVSPGNRLRAALEILDRSGYVKVEKRLTVTADAESIIRELNRLGSAPEQVDATMPVNAPHTTSNQETREGEITDAEYVEITGVVADAD